MIINPPDISRLTLNLSPELAKVPVPAYPTLQLLVANGGETTYRFEPRTSSHSSPYRAEAGELLRAPDLRFLPDIRENLQYRALVDDQAKRNREHRAAQMFFCRASCLYWINVFVWTYDPRLKNIRSTPMVTYQIQDRFVSWLLTAIANDASGIGEKSREIGASWLLAEIMVWLSIFHNDMTCYMMSMIEDNVDDRTADSLLGKCRYILSNLPEWMRGGWEERKIGVDTSMQIKIPATGSLIKGILSKSTAGRSGRATIVVADEFAFVEESEKVLRSLMALSNCKTYISTANGMSNAFYRMRSDPRANLFRMHYSEHPLKDQEWVRWKKAEPEMTEESWASEFEIDYAGSTAGRVYPQFISLPSPEAPWVHLKQDNHSFWGFEPQYDVLTGQDYGISDEAFFVFAQRKPAPPEFQAKTKETLVFFDEDGDTNTTVDEWRWVLNSKGYRYSLHVGDDRTGNQRESMGSSWVRNFRRYIDKPVHVKRAGRVVHPGPPIIVKTKRTSIARYIQTVQRLLNTPGAIAVNAAGCPLIVAGFQNWAYPTEINPITGKMERVKDAGPDHGGATGYSHRMWAVAHLLDYLYGGYVHKPLDAECERCSATAPSGTRICPVCGFPMKESAWDFPAPKLARL